MGIYTVKRKNCDCMGGWDTYGDNGGLSSIYMTKYCEKHQHKKGNNLHYNCRDLFLKYMKKGEKTPLKTTFHSVIMDTHSKTQPSTNRQYTILQLCITTSDNLEVKKEIFDENKMITYSEFNDCKSIEFDEGDNCIITCLFEGKNEIVDDWEAYDYPDFNEWK